MAILKAAKAAYRLIPV
ncbi:uncharacterized protein FFC1_03786 [Fusarium fujikuroi]|nr:uncharacterized protein FFC1_03786 [Fusarium fujikuroi]